MFLSAYALNCMPVTLKFRGKMKTIFLESIISNTVATSIVALFFPVKEHKRSAVEIALAQMAANIPLLVDGSHLKNLSFHVVISVIDLQTLDC